MENKIRQLIKESMIEKNKNKQITYKNILETAQKTAKKTNATVTDDMLISAVKNEIKQLNDLLSYCTPNTDKYNETKEKITYCESVLPTMASESDIMDFLVSNSIDKNMGVCMKQLKAHFGSTMDGKMASNVVKQYIK